MKWMSFAAGVDMKDCWFLSTLRQSGREPDVPHIQSLEFYAHELFAFDAGAIRELLKMGRTELAVMTATEEPNAIPELLPLLDEMAASTDPAVSAAIREYLRERSTMPACIILEARPRGWLISKIGEGPVEL